MSQLLAEIQRLAQAGEVRISEHGYDELAEDGIMAGEVVHGLATAQVVEEYADYPKGPCLLVRQQERNGSMIHAVWGIPAGFESPAVLITAYRPDPRRWSDDFLRRKK
ncbi:MAG: DUF4258 domain-containing protein [Phycisphaerae bacterium]|nr:DUF4258 domain-containing protein [Phycisphaerae bacterium]